MTEIRHFKVVFSNGNMIRIQVPPGAKVTYSGTNPSKPMHYDSATLRIYATEKEQIAAFPNVASFYDESLKLEVWHKEGPNGGFWESEDGEVQF